MLCPPRWACLRSCLPICLPSGFVSQFCVPICSPSGFVFHLGWGAVSASLGLSPVLSPIWLCLPVLSPHLFPIWLCLSPWLGCCVRLVGLVSQFVSQFEILELYSLEISTFVYWCLLIAWTAPFWKLNFAMITSWNRMHTPNKNIYQKNNCSNKDSRDEHCHPKGNYGSQMKRNNLFRGREPYDEVPLLCPCSARTVFAWMPVSTNIIEFRHYSHVHHILRNFEKSKGTECLINSMSFTETIYNLHFHPEMWLEERTVKGSWTMGSSVLCSWSPETCDGAVIQFWGINLLELHGSNSKNYQSEPTKNHTICIARAYPNHIKQNTLVVVRVALLGTATSGRPKVFAFGNLVARRIIMNHYHWLHLNSTISEWC